MPRLRGATAVDHPLPTAGLTLYIAVEDAKLTSWLSPGLPTEATRSAGSFLRPTVSSTLAFSLAFASDMLSASKMLKLLGVFSSTCMGVESVRINCLRATLPHAFCCQTRRA